MIKFFGACLVLFATTALGHKLAEKYRLRPKQLQELELLLEMAASEINYTASPLPEIMEKLGHRFSKSTGKLFSNVNRVMVNSEYTPEEAFRKAEDQCKQDLALSEEDWDLLRNLYLNLGKSDIDDQLKHIELCLAHLRNHFKTAQEERKKNERMWRYLGILTGLLLIVLLW